MTWVKPYWRPVFVHRCWKGIGVLIDSDCGKVTFCVSRKSISDHFHVQGFIFVAAPEVEHCSMVRTQAMHNSALVRSCTFGSNIHQCMPTCRAAGLFSAMLLPSSQSLSYSQTVPLPLLASLSRSAHSNSPGSFACQFMAIPLRAFFRVSRELA